MNKQVWWNEAVGFLLLGVILTLFAPGCAKVKDALSSTTNLGTGTSDLSGVVKNGSIQGTLISPDGKKMSNQQVVLYTASSISSASFISQIRTEQVATAASIAAVTTTDANGNFKFSGLDYGNYTLVTQATGDNAAYFTKVSISSVSPALQLGSISLVLKGSLTGTVTLNNNESPLGIEVFVPGTDIIAKTDDKGKFTIDLPEGTYTVIMAKSGFQINKVSDVTITQKSVTTLQSAVLTEESSKSGVVWHVGSGAPADSLGSNSDLYLDSGSNYFYTKANGKWTKQGTLTGVSDSLSSSTAGSQWYTGSGDPSATVGTEGDFYLDSTTNKYFSKKANGWQLTGNLSGKSGTGWITGSADPDNSTGSIGDLYLNTVTNIYFLKGTNGWLSQGSLKGAAGTNGTSGQSAPSVSVSNKDGVLVYTLTGFRKSDYQKVEVQSSLQQYDNYFQSQKLTIPLGINQIDGLPNMYPYSKIRLIDQSGNFTNFSVPVTHTDGASLSVIDVPNAPDDKLVDYSISPSGLIFFLTESQTGEDTLFKYDASMNFVKSWDLGNNLGYNEINANNTNVFFSNIKTGQVTYLNHTTNLDGSTTLLNSFGTSQLYDTGMDESGNLYVFSSETVGGGKGGGGGIIYHYNLYDVNLNLSTVLTNPDYVLQEQIEPVHNGGVLDVYGILTDFGTTSLRLSQNLAAFGLSHDVSNPNIADNTNFINLVPMAISGKVYLFGSQNQPDLQLGIVDPVTMSVVSLTANCVGNGDLTFRKLGRMKAGNGHLFYTINSGRKLVRLPAPMKTRIEFSN